MNQNKIDVDKEIRAVIFDVDGVVFNTHATDGSYLWQQTIKEDLGLSKEHLSKIFSSKWIELTKGKISTLDYFHAVFQDPIFQELNVTAQSFVNYWLSKDNNVNWAVVELVKSLKVPCYLGTNQESHRSDYIMKLVGDFFHGYFSSYQIGHIKPEQAFFEHIENDLNLKPNELLLIDDTADNIEGAKKRQWNTYFYRNDLDSLKIFLHVNNLL